MSRLVCDLRGDGTHRHSVRRLKNCHTRRPCRAGLDGRRGSSLRSDNLRIGSLTRLGRLDMPRVAAGLKLQAGVCRLSRKAVGHPGDAAGMRRKQWAAQPPCASRRSQMTGSSLSNAPETISGPLRDEAALERLFRAHFSALCEEARGTSAKRRPARAEGRRGSVPASVRRSRTDRVRGRPHGVPARRRSARSAPASSVAARARDTSRRGRPEVRTTTPPPRPTSIRRGRT